MLDAPRILLQMNSIFRVRFAWYPVCAAVAGLLLYLVAPILSPFLFAAILAYICLPLTDRLARRMPRWLAVAIALVLLLLGLSMLVLIVAPMVETQFAAFLVFGHLFGFFGVLLALPASAALLVGLRHLRAQYLASDLYRS